LLPRRLPNRWHDDQVYRRVARHLHSGSLSAPLLPLTNIAPHCATFSGVVASRAHTRQRYADRLLPWTFRRATCHTVQDVAGKPQAALPEPIVRRAGATTYAAIPTTVPDTARSIPTGTSTREATELAGRRLTRASAPIQRRACSCALPLWTFIMYKTAIATSLAGYTTPTSSLLNMARRGQGREAGVRGGGGRALAGCMRLAHERAGRLLGGLRRHLPTAHSTLCHTPTRLHLTSTALPFPSLPHRSHRPPAHCVHCLTPVPQHVCRCGTLYASLASSAAAYSPSHYACLPTEQAGGTLSS